MPDSEGSPTTTTTTQWRKASRLYRRPPGRAWLVGLALIPLLLALIGYGTLDRSRSQNGGQPGPTGALPTLTEPAPSGAPSGLTLAPLSITRHGDETTLAGNLPDPAAKRGLLDMVIASLGNGANVIDNLSVVPGIKALDFAAAGPVFDAASAIRDFSLAVKGDSVTLAGTAATPAQADALENAAEDAFKNVNIVNKLAITSLMTPPSVPTLAPAPSFAPLAILRSGNTVTVNGDLPDAGTRASLLDMLAGVFGRGVRVADKLNIKPGATTPDVAALTAVFRPAGSIPDFAFKIAGDTVTLTGTAASESQVGAVGTAAEKAWPNLNIVNELGPGKPASPASSSASAPSPSPASPAPAAGAACGNLQADITGLLHTPVGFATDGYTLASNSTQQLTQVAEKLKGCPDARVAVNGYTDNTGSDAINGPLSDRRAKSVADFLVAHGVPAGRVTAKGFGAANPIASNDTPGGRAQNRRVAIVVS